MIKVIPNNKSLPNRLVVACSGGPDSMAALHFLWNRGRRDIVAAYFHHGTAFGDAALQLVRAYCKEIGVPFVWGQIHQAKAPKGRSQEDYWREHRYNFLDSFSGTKVTAHHLDDAVETWLFSSFHGRPTLIPYKRPGYLRPFLATRKSELVGWCERNQVPYLVDPSNQDTKHMRNRIRHIVVPEVLAVNPGIHTTVRKKILQTI